MTPFTCHRGIAAPLLRINIDTDAIIPSREMRTTGKRGLAEGLFAGWRYTEPDGRIPNPEFVLNRPAYKGASILLSGDNFGCGSSREHAVWALLEFGIRCVIAPSFGAIFHNNCIRNGLLPVRLPEAQVKTLARQMESDSQSEPLEINLERLEIIAPDGSVHSFEMEPAHRKMLLEGLDLIGATLQLEQQIDLFIARDRQRRAWAYR